MLVSEPATHHEERSVISDEDVSFFEDVCLRMPAVFVTGTFGFIGSPGVEDGLPRLMKASDVLAREESFARECDLRQARELPRLRDSTSPDEICELFGKLTRRSVVPAPLVERGSSPPHHCLPERTRATPRRGVPDSHLGNQAPRLCRSTSAPLNIARGYR